MKTTAGNLIRHAIFFLAAVLAAAAAGAPAAVAEPVKVAIVPFKFNSEKDMSFLRDGIYDMLASRLAWEGRVVVLGRKVSENAFRAVSTPIKVPDARNAGARIGAQWVLFGSLTIFGNSVSIDIKMGDVSGAKDTLSFFNQSEGMEGVIPRINLIAQDINARVFGRGTSTAGLPSQAPQPQKAQPPIYARPESLVGQGDRDYSPFVIEGGTYSESPGFWKSRNLKTDIVSMALGDVTGDGKIETVLASSQAVYVFQNDQGRFTKLAQIDATPRIGILGVDAADVNGNGTDEIFVTAISTLDTVSTLYGSLESFVLEWNGKTYARIAEKQNWYLRVIDHPLRGRILLGQGRGIDDPFFGAIEELGWFGADLRPTGNPAWTKGLPVFGFMLGDATNEGVDSALALDQGDFLWLYNLGGKREWKSDEFYGGSELFIKRAPNSASLVYLGQRIFIADLNDNGHNEVIVIRNHSLTGKFFQNYRQYGGGEIMSLSWNGLGLAQNWHTRKVSGYLSDLAIGDINNDGKIEIAVAVVREGKTPLSDGKSAVIVYDLGRIQAAEEGL